MADNTGIEWTEATWNPVTGCTKVSAGCKNCYAERMAKRLQAMGQAHYKDGFAVRCHEDALTIPLRWRKPRRIFVNSMSDLFHKDVPFEFIDRVFAVMALCPQHTFQVLTKRPERMAEYMQRMSGNHEGIIRQTGISQMPPFDLDITWPLPNVWLGTSIEDQATADARIPHLLRCSAAVRFLSVEPMLGPVNLGIAGGLPIYHEAAVVVDRMMPRGTQIPRAGRGWCRHDGNLHPWLSWVICGGESGPGARPMHPDWARSIRDQCQAASVPFFFKQNGEWAPGECVEDEVRYETVGYFNSKWEPVSDDWVSEADYGVLLYRVGKKKAGRTLDGRTWDEMPEVKHG